MTARPRAAEGRALVVNMQAFAADCGVCGADATGLQLAVPVYNGLVLPNDWPGPWGGIAACASCYAAQQSLTEPVGYDQLRRRSGARKGDQT